MHTLLAKQTRISPELSKPREKPRGFWCRKQGTFHCLRTQCGTIIRYIYTYITKHYIKYNSENKKDVVLDHVEHSPLCKCDDDNLKYSMSAIMLK